MEYKIVSLPGDESHTLLRTLLSLEIAIGLPHSSGELIASYSYCCLMGCCCCNVITSSSGSWSEEERATNSESSLLLSCIGSGC